MSFLVLDAMYTKCRQVQVRRCPWPVPLATPYGCTARRKDGNISGVNEELASVNKELANVDQEEASVIKELGNLSTQFYRHNP